MLTRRSFLHNSGAIGVASAVAPMLVMADPVPQSALPGYRAAVCILLAGGNDSFNMLVPTDRAQNIAYQLARGNLALGSKSLLTLPGPGRLGLHSEMPEIRDLYAKGEVAFLANVGTLKRPFDRRSAQPLPEDLLSHSGQISQWQTCAQTPSASSGWAGRMADLMQESACDGDASMNLSVSGPNVMQLGSMSSSYSVTPAKRRDANAPPGVDFDFVNHQMATRLANIGRPGTIRRKATRQEIAQTNTQAVIDSAAPLAPGLQNKFAQDPFSQRLGEVARLIAAHKTMKSRRQTFFVSFDGWDHHHQLLSNQAAMLPLLSQGLSSFRNVLVELGIYENVTTFTTSEFGRALASNGSGSDHGWGGHQIVLGGSVSGGTIYGDYPDLSPSGAHHVGDGVFAPSTSTDEYFAELALWLGVPVNQLSYVLPNLPAFYKARQGRPPLGFLA